MPIQELRSQIDALDAEMTALFCQRMAISAQIGCIKQMKGMPFSDPAREAEILSHAATVAGEDLAAYVRQFYHEILTLSRVYQQAVTGR